MRTIRGNLITLAENGFFDVIIHGANCFCTMGSGIAKEIRQKYPQAYDVDLTTRKGDRSKLGTYTSVEVENAYGTNFVIVNAYTQYDMKRNFNDNSVHLDYHAVEKVFAKIKIDFVGKNIGYPKIGAGLAGGDWNKISQIIDRELAGMKHTCVEWDGK